MALINAGTTRALVRRITMYQPAKDGVEGLSNAVVEGLPIILSPGDIHSVKVSGEVNVDGFLKYGSPASSEEVAGARTGFITVDVDLVDEEAV